MSASLTKGALQDLVLALRTVRRRPLWALSTVAVLSLGLAGSAAMFSAFDVWVVRPLPFERPEELVDLRTVRPLIGDDDVGLSPADWRDLAERQTVFRAMAAYSRTTFNLDDEVEAWRVDGVKIDAALLPTLAVEPALGRGFEGRDDVAGKPAAVALIGDRLWRERWSADPAVLGRTLRIDGVAHQIVGVMPPRFEFPEWAQVWTPLGLDPESGGRERRWVQGIARLAPGVSLEAARDQLARIGAELADQHPLTNTGRTPWARPLREMWLPDVIVVALAASLAATLLVLVVICANVGSLFLAELEGRRRELALRTALGAGRLQTLRPFLFQSLLLAGAAGGIGCLLGTLWMKAMLGRVPVDPPYLFATSLDGRTLAFTLAAALSAGALCGLMPLARTGGPGVASALRSSGATGRARPGLRGLLVAGELALTTALLVLALLLVDTFLRQRAVDPGYRRDGVVTADLSLTSPEHADEQERVRFVERLLSGLGETAGVEAIGLTTLRPADGCSLARMEAEGAPAERGEGVPTCVVGVAGDTLGVLAIPTLAGRSLRDDEWRGGGDGVLVSARLAARLWADGQAVGRRLRAVEVDGAPWRTVVGVVGDVEAPRDMVVDANQARAQLYLPYAEHPGRSVALVVGTGLPVDEAAAALRREVRRAGGSVPLSEVVTLERSVAIRQWTSRFFGEQLLLYALVALAIAVFGLYGLISDGVTRSRYELAMRIALGASRRQVLATVAGRGARMIGGGIGAGVLLGVIASRLGSAMLVSSAPAAARVFVLVVVVLTSVAALATWLPARRAAGLEPGRLLRSD